ncbi:MAG: hypothetical protein C5B48_04455 [Candidatus Rokuibacteriota bacterium]|nr:MAG: hypothetical protein C5B48_04455 [Candidatus Rokubacteria bacterium]
MLRRGLADRGARLRRYAVGALAVLSITALGIAMIAHATLDPDESQHLHAAWLVGQGQVPYADFWEHHTPLLYYALAPVTRAFAERPAVYFAGRVIMSLTAVATLGVVAALGRRLGPGVGPAAAALLAVQLRFLQHSIQVRPDGPALLTWLAAVLMLVRWRERGGGWRLWAAGVWLGITATLTPKAALVGLGAGAVVLIGSSGPALAPGPMARSLAWLAGGSAVPMAALLAWLAWIGGARALQGFWLDIIVMNLKFPDFVKQTPVGAESTGFVALALVGIAAAIRRSGLSIVRDPFHGPVLIPALIVSAILALPSTPAVYAYAWFPVVASASLYAGQGLMMAFERGRTRGGTTPARLASIAVIGAFVAPAVVAGVLAFPRNSDNEADFSLMRRELDYACPGEAVVDSRPLAVFRPTALRYHALPLGVRIWIANGTIPADSLVGDLERARAPVGVLDGRLRRVGGSVAQFITAHYMREPDGLLVAGATLTLRGHLGETDVDVLVPGLHHVFLDPGVRAAIDGVDTRSAAVDLTAGRHQISWSGGPGTLRLMLAPCAQRLG